MTPGDAERPQLPAPSPRAGVLDLLRAHPARVQRTAIGAVFATIAAVTTVATVASAAPATTVARRPAWHPSTAATTQALQEASPVDALSSATPTATPTSTRTAAPVDHGVISGLAANGIPTVALNAYRVAAARMANADPGCGIPWYLLAGIGREESDHGRFGGAVLHSDGVSTPKIIGPALDGKVWDRIPAPADGLALDGDAVYAHALGPMQFIPSTWALYGTDADGDGVANIFDINDAALTAARYLCAAGGDLTTTAGRTRAVLAYNHNAQYLAQVLALAEAYHKGVPISGIPVGITTGGLPKVTAPKHLPPANPGAPTATGGGAKSSPGTGRSTPTSAPSHPRSTPSGGSGSGGSGSGGAPRPTPPATTSRPSSPTSSAPPKAHPTGSTSAGPSPSKSCDGLAHALGMC